MGKTGNSLKVLYGECDAEVLAAQAVPIQEAGHLVETALGRKRVEEALRKGGFDVIILGGTLTKNDRHHLPYMAKKTNPEIKVMVMHTDGERHPYVDGNIDTGRSMQELVGKILTAMPQTQRAKAKGAGAGK